MHLIFFLFPSSLAAPLIGLDLLGFQVDSGFGTGGSGLSFHASLDLRCHGQECLFDIVRCLGGCFEEFNAERVGKFLALFGGNDAFGGEVGFVADQKLVDILRGVSIDFVQPLFDVVKGLLIRDVVDDNDPVRASVVRRRNGSEALLAGGVPDLKLDRFLIQLDRADFLDMMKSQCTTIDIQHGKL